MKINLRKIVLLALFMNTVLPLYAADSAVQESNSKFKELKKLLFCIKSKKGCSKKQIAAIVVTVAGLIVVISGGSYGLYRLFKKEAPEQEDQGIRATEVTPLMAAVMNGNLEEVKKLIEQEGHDIHQTDKQGYTVADYDKGINTDVTLYLALRGVYQLDLKNKTQEEKVKYIGDFIADMTNTKEKWEARKQEIRQAMNEADANKLINYIEAEYAIADLP
jgi:hypothetical protein